MTEAPPKITAIAPWFGGKRTLAPVIVQELGPHKAYWEPFCGGISIVFAKERCRQEVLNDAHGDLTNLAIVVSSPRCVELYERASRTLYSEGLYDACLATIQAPEETFANDPQRVTDAHLERAYAYLVLSWMGRNGAAGTARINYVFTLRYTNNGGDSATRWKQVAASIPDWHARLSGVVITRRDGIALTEKIEDTEGCAIYCDPPYIEEGDAYAHAFASSGGMFGDDHQRLADALRAKRRARVVVSYYDHPRLPELYPGWTIRRVTMNKALAAQNKRGVVRSTAPEVLLINGPSNTTLEAA